MGHEQGRTGYASEAEATAELGKREEFYNKAYDAYPSVAAVSPGGRGKWQWRLEYTDEDLAKGRLHEEPAPVGVAPETTQGTTDDDVILTEKLGAIQYEESAEEPAQ